MKINLKFNNQRVLKNISGAKRFRSELQNPIHHQHDFSIRHISSETLLEVVNNLEYLEYDHDSLSDFLLDREISIGPRDSRVNEINRVISKDKSLDAVIVGFPFKCQVPIKTNYHQYPDLGEMMFLHRLGKIAREVNKHTDFKMTVTILEETKVLRKVFGDENSDSDYFPNKLTQIISLLGHDNYLQVKSLASAMFPDENDFESVFEEKYSDVEANLMRYNQLIKSISSTIALSIPTNYMNIDSSRKYIFELFNGELDLADFPELRQCIIGYIAFIELQKDSGYKQKYFKNYLQMSLNPKKGRLAIRPTISDVDLLPHHGVPLIRKNDDSYVFEILYFIDLLNNDKIHLIEEVRDKDDNFLYYFLDNN